MYERQVTMKKYLILLIIVVAIIASGFYLLHFLGLGKKEIVCKNILDKYPPVEFSKNDRVLVIAPHPDDEVLANASVILKAKAQGADVKVVFVTFGEHNTSTMLKFFLVPVPTTADILAERRHKECLNAAKVLGLNEKDLIFLGFPDFGTLKIWDDHFTNKPYVAAFDLHDKVFYKGSYEEGILFTAPNELSLFEETISSYKPTKIFYPSTLDLNPDHRATGLFTEAALFDINTIKPKLFAYFVHSEDWPEPIGYYPEDFLGVPSYFTNLDATWVASYLSKREEEIKLEAIKAHLSQYLTKPKFMSSFARKDELFSTTYQYGLEKKLPLWSRETMQKVGILPYIESVSVSDKTDSYEFKIKLYKGALPFSKIILFVYPEVEGKAFVNAPKYKLIIRRGIRKEVELALFDRGKEIISKKDALTGIFTELLLNIDMQKTHFEGSERFFFSILVEEGDYRISETPWWLINAQKTQ